MNLAEQIQQTLNSDPYIRGCKLSVSQTDNCIIVEGTVSTFYLKQMVQEAVIRFLRSISDKITLKIRISVV